MKRALLLLGFLFPLCCLGQVTAEGGLTYVNFVPSVSGLSEEFYFSLGKESSQNPVQNLGVQLTAVSEDVYINLSRARKHLSFFVFGESPDFPIKITKPKAAETVAMVQPENQVKPKVETKDVALTNNSTDTNKTQPKDVVADPTKESGEGNKPVGKEVKQVTATDSKKSSTEEIKTSQANDPQQGKGLVVAGAATVTDSSPVPTDKKSDASRSNSPVAESKPAGADLVRTGQALPTYHALVIGVSNYKFAGPGLGSLERPVMDATKLSETLVKYYSFDAKNVHLLKDATRGDIIDELESLGGNLGEKDNLVIFYAGHGYWDENLEIGYWLPSDAMQLKRSTWISNSTIKDYVSGMKTKHTLLISDACFSGSIFKVREVDASLNELGVSKLYQLPSRKAMTSGNLKTVPDKSKFFEYFNKRLVENEDKYLSARQLFHSFFNAVINNTNTMPQFGVIQETGDEGGEFIFIRK